QVDGFDALDIGTGAGYAPCPLRQVEGLMLKFHFPVLTALVAGATLLALAGLATAQDIPRTASGRPDLQGIWQVSNRASYDLQDHVARHDMPAGMGVVEGGEIPYLPPALEQKLANFSNRASADPL